MTAPSHGPPPHHPAVAREIARADDVQVRVADLVTRFAGSMPFVYAHVVLFGVWMLVVEGTPWPALTLLVSLEAIFLSTFVMIGQNRQAAFQRTKADEDFASEQRVLHDHSVSMQVIERLVRQLRDGDDSPVDERSGDGT